MMTFFLSSRWPSLLFFLCLLYSLIDVYSLFLSGKAAFRTRPNKFSVIKMSAKLVEVTFEPSGKIFTAMQGDLIGELAKKSGVAIPYNCKQGRCGSCEVRLNGRVTAKACQGAKVPSGPTKKLKIQVINKKPLA